MVYASDLRALAVFFVFQVIPFIYLTRRPRLFAWPEM